VLTRIAELERLAADLKMIMESMEGKPQWVKHFKNLVVRECILNAK
jgi:hypothetical protein